MEKILQDYLVAAEANLISYIASGDKRAIRAGEGMVAQFKADFAKLQGSN